jgi:Zn-dependent protease
MNYVELLQKILIYAIPILFAITVHEVAHGWVANKLGDPTAKMLGRLTLNPIKHIDLVGTIIVPLVLLFLGGFIFGWAKPVPITWQNLKNPKRDMALVAIAGPGVNLIMALLWAFIAKWGFILRGYSPEVSNIVISMGGVGVMMNLVLLVLNLIPIPPLDGSRVVSSFLPGPLEYQYNRLEPFGFFILIGLLATGLLSKFLNPIIMTLLQWISWIFGF